MKNYLIVLLLIGCSLTAFSQESGTLTVNLTQIKSKYEGPITFLLFSQEEGFPNEPGKALKQGIIQSYEDRATYIFEDIPFGRYAVSVFLDENRNGEIDTNLIGFPKEPVGASKMSGLGKPSFKKCSFQISSASQSIDLTFING
ncbi:MAG: DUF2141 domain-containing protein [Bacteroidota bacterium]